MDYCVYYDKKNQQIMDFFPKSLTEEFKEKVRFLWNEDIPKNILILLSKKDELTAPKIKQEIGHSMSTLHENIAKLERAGLIKTKMVYKGNKQKIITPTGLFVTKNPKLTEKITRFLNQGLWVDSKSTQKIVEFLDSNPGKDFTVEEISAKTRIPVDEVQTLLNNWDAYITRSFSNFLKETPFVKKVVYRSRKK